MFVYDDLIMSAVKIGPPTSHCLTADHYTELEFLTFEEIRFLAAIVLSVHPDDGMAYCYPLFEYKDVPVDLDQTTLYAIGKAQAAELISEAGLNKGTVVPTCAGGPTYETRDVDLNSAAVSEIAQAIDLKDHLLMRGLGCLLRADMCWRHREIAEAAVMLLHVSLDASFQMMLRSLRERGNINPTSRDAGQLLDEVFNPSIETGNYFQDYYEDRIRVIHPFSRLGIFPFAPLAADDYYFLRHALVEVYYWLVTKRKLHPLPPPLNG
ncbi:MAG: hypothetical protein JO001_18700 [Alphaproteobacteria bacterium]|nr:hypothetical protein [Alphaproteobacteria bacterium]